MQGIKSNLKVAFLTSTNPNDKRSWSGIHYCMLQSLHQQFHVVEPIGPIDSLVLKSLGILNKLTRFFFKKGYNHSNSILRSYLLSLTINRKIRKGNYDVLFAPAASTEVAFLKTKVPVLYLSDSSFGQLNGYYEVFSDLFSFSQKESNYIEQRAINNSSFFVYPSKWAADYVSKNYGVSPDKIEIVPFGANINDVDIKYIEKKIIPNQKVNILFLGVNWERKGGPMVYDTFLLLRENGYDVSLTICGCTPKITNPNVTIIPFLNKNNKEDLERFVDLMIDTHFLFVPTKADCSPIVFCEANSFGIPVITNKTGGVSELVNDGVNGYCLEAFSKPVDYSNKIAALIDNGDLYQELSKGSRKRYEEELNWDVWGEKMREILLKIKK